MQLHRIEHLGINREDPIPPLSTAPCWNYRVAKQTPCAPFLLFNCAYPATGVREACHYGSVEGIIDKEGVESEIEIRGPSQAPYGVRGAKFLAGRCYAQQMNT